MKHKILMIDDDETLCELVRLNLITQGYEVISVNDGDDAIKTVQKNNPDLIILDVMMPGQDGYEVCERLRKITDVPILFLTAKGREQDLVRGFEVGGDDYVHKPFSLRELEARISALIKRSKKQSNSIMLEYDDGHLRVNLETKHVYRDGKLLHLTPTEYRLLACLMRKIGAVVTHEDLLKEAWGDGYTNAIASLSLYIRYLREKIESDPGNPKYIITKWGVGYWFADHSQKEA